jgi:hypothetical protein
LLRAGRSCAHEKTDQHQACQQYSTFEMVAQRLDFRRVRVWKLDEYERASRERHDNERGEQPMEDSEERAISQDALQSDGLLKAMLGARIPESQMQI